MLAYAAATGAPPSSWTREPEKVFGFSLGAPLPDSIDCPPRYSAMMAARDSACVRRKEGRDDLVELDGLPNVGFFIESTGYLEGGRLRMIALSIDQKDFARLMDIMIERYGKPTNGEVGAVTNKLGAQARNVQMIWAGRKLTIIAIERAGQMNRSFVTFEDNEMGRESRKAKRDSIKGAASKF